MADIISSADLQLLQKKLDEGKIAEFYNFLSARNYAYAGWAGGVAGGNSIAGVAAVEYLKGTALMGIGGREPHSPSQSQIDAVKTDMAQAYLDNLVTIALSSGTNSVNRDISASEVWLFHELVFEKNGLTIQSWTLEAPFRIIEKLEGSAGLEKYWQFMRDTTGDDSYDTTLANLATLAFMHKMTVSKDPEIKLLATEWMKNVPGIYNWDQIERSLEIAAVVGLVKAESGLTLVADVLVNNIPSLWSNHNQFEMFINEISASFQTAAQTKSPLVLDLDGDGFQTLSKNDKVQFDHDKNGFAERSGWVSSEEGILVYDKNHNGQIDDGGELFGNSLF
jgi:hypothetical protein